MRRLLSTTPRPSPWIRAALLLCCVPLLHAFAGDERRDRLVEAVGEVLHSGSAAQREQAREVLRSDPDGAVTVLLQALEELAAARRPPVAVASVEATPTRIAEDAVVRIYDVRDLVQRGDTPEQLTERVRRLLAEEGTVARQGDGLLIVRSSTERQAAVEEALAGLRHEASEIVRVEARVVAAPFGTPLGRAASACRPGDVLDLPDPPSTVAGWLEGGDAEVVAAPALACFPGQTASVQIGAERSFVEDFDVEVAQSPTSAAELVDPIIGVVFEGVDVRIGPTVTEDGEVRLELHATTTNVELEPFRTSLGVAGTEELEIQVPSTFRTEVDRSLQLADGATAVVRLGDDRDGSRYLVLTVTRESLEDE